MKKKSTSEGNFVILKDSMSAYFLAFVPSDFKNNYIKQCVYSYIVKPITYKNVKNLPITALGTRVGAKISGLRKYLTIVT